MALLYFFRCFGSAAEMIMVAFFCTAALLYHYYIESRDDLSERLASAAISSPSRCPVSYQSSFSSQIVQTTSHESNFFLLFFCLSFLNVKTIGNR